MLKSNKTSAIIVGAGKGERFSSTKNKITVKLKGKEVFRYSLETFQKSELVTEIIFVGSLPFNTEILKKEYPKLKKIVPGGSHREESVWNGLKETSQDSGIIMVHDAARPLFPSFFIQNLYDTLSSNDGAIPVLSIQDAVKSITNSGEIKTYKKNTLFRTQTPQAFKKDLLFEAFHKYKESLPKFRDETEMILAYKPNATIIPIPGSYLAEKVTSPEDLDTLSCFLPSEIRIGNGYDFHYFVQGRTLILGGCKIKYGKGLEGDSDGDVLSHSILDSLLGALSMGDIGRYIGIKTKNAMNAKSVTFLQQLLHDPMVPKFKIAHIDSTIVCRDPLLTPYMEEMKNSLSDALLLDPKRINLKSTSDKGMDAAGEGKGIRAITIATIELI